MTLAKFFAKQSDFRKWLAKNHTKETELLVGFYKVGSGRSSMTWPQSVDEALCFGWIDGVRKNIDEESYSIRFTPRKPTSIWSAINIKKVADLTEKGLMNPAGIAAFEKRKEHKSRIYAYENEPVKLSPAFEKQFKTNKIAWKFFTTQAPSYQRTIIHRIMSAKQEATQLKRLEQTIAASENQTRLR
ncbi:MAG TPA: YdeI/OmpD-associated family protein [Pyrinomonadaceae bacterium]|nr:YdeI/OmpD-associated family protein [Pyrinomonadaceae bacterium]